MPNTFAYIVLISWPLISLIFYKRMPIVNATFWTIVGGFLILPVKVAIDFPFIPPLNKETIPAIAALIGCKYIKKSKINFFPEKGVERWFIIILLIIPFISMVNNQETINSIRGLTFLDSISSTVKQYLVLLPLILGMQLIKTQEDQLILFKLLVISSLFYSIPILYEIRMSPQWHTMMYGFFPHSFLQQYRASGFRAVVFIGHGLTVSMFVAIALGAATVLLRKKIRIIGLSPWLIIIFLFMVLVLNKSTGPLLLGLVLFLTISWASQNMIRRASLLIAFIVLLYPLLLMSDIFPHEKLIALATDINPARGESLAFRFLHENLLFEHAQHKLFFGWGGWGRNRLEFSVTDGYWIIIFGVYGFIGFVALFGLLVTSIWKAAKTSVLLKSESDKKLLLGHALIISIIMVDQLPNASLSAWMFLLVGALFGRVRYIKNQNMLNM